MDSINYLITGENFYVPAPCTFKVLPTMYTHSQGYSYAYDGSARCRENRGLKNESKKILCLQVCTGLYIHILCCVLDCGHLTHSIPHDHRFISEQIYRKIYH